MHPTEEEAERIKKIYLKREEESYVEAEKLVMAQASSEAYEKKFNEKQLEWRRRSCAPMSGGERQSIEREKKYWKKLSPEERRKQQVAPAGQRDRAWYASQLKEMDAVWEKKNLNEERNDFRWKDASLLQEPTAVILRDVKKRLVHLIKQADWVFGCVAWLTDFNILDTLASKKGVAFVVQKEDFLRPDAPGRGGSWKKTLREKYDRLPDMTREEFGEPLSLLSVCSDPTLQAVRCMGNARKESERFAPLMHHKFCLFSRGERQPDGKLPMPYAVWTGSYNWSENASRSIENAVFLVDESAIAAFFLEFQQVEALSEPLDWEQEYMEPQWHVGT